MLIENYLKRVFFRDILWWSYNALNDTLKVQSNKQEIAQVLAKLTYDNEFKIEEM